MTKPLAGLKVVCYYGCLLTRPPSITQADHPEYPMRMDRLVEALGAESLDWGYKTDCCGGSLALTRADTAMRLSEKILRNAQDVGADAIVVACSLCHVNLDTRQDVISRAGRAYNVPIIYFTQLMGLAMGMAAADLGLQKHLTDPRPLLREKAAGLTGFRRAIATSPSTSQGERSNEADRQAGRRVPGCAGLQESRRRAAAVARPWRERRAPPWPAWSAT